MSSPCPLEDTASCVHVTDALGFSSYARHSDGAASLGQVPNLLRNPRARDGQLGYSVLRAG
jgi:hypothetical protein